MTFDVAFLGGASEVGASCIAVRFGDAWLVIDAGVRMSGAAEEQLPDFSALEGAHVAAIVITHAHADHIGALPLLHQRFPSAPIYTTSASIQLMTIMLADAIAVMAKRAAEELELPLYDSAAVEQMLRRLTPLAVDDRHAIPEIPGLVVSLRLAGHIAGAVSVGLEHPEGRIVISGDISIAPQRTIQGAQAPLVTQPDLLILESTYGGREHAPRHVEEQRLAAEVAAAIQRGGHVLIPAFALGRAQEVILILQEAQRRRAIPHFTVWIDDWLLQSRTQRSHISARAVAATMTPGQCYDLDTLVGMVGQPADDLAWRLHVARLVVANPRMFALTPAAQPLQDARWWVRLAAGWEGAGAEEASQPRPDTHAIQQRIDWHLRGASDLYRRSIDTATGDVTLRFRFPLTAEARYGAQLAALRAELPVRVAINTETDHTALLNIIQLHLRPIMAIKGVPTVDQSARRVTVVGAGEPSAEEQAVALTAITVRTGFDVVVLPETAPLVVPRVASQPAPAKAKHQLVVGTPAAERCDRTVAVAVAREELGEAALQIDLDPTNGFIIVRFPLPHADIQRYVVQLEEVVRRTGWAVRVRPHAQHTALEAAARAALPAGVELVLPLSVYTQRQTVEGRYRGQLDAAAIQAALVAFGQATGWQLLLRPVAAGAAEQGDAAAP